MLSDSSRRQEAAEPGEARPEVSRLPAGFFTRYAYSDELDRQRASTLMVMSLLFGVLGLFGVLALAAFPGAMPPALVVPNIVLALVYLVLFSLVWLGRLRLASFGFVAMTLIVPTVQIIPYGFLGPEVAALAYIVSIVAAAFLLGPLWGFITAGTSVVLVLVVTLTPAAAAGEGVELATLLITAVESIFLMLVAAVLAWLLSRSLIGWAISAQRRARQLEAAVVVSETANTAPNLAVLLDDVVERIRETYGFYHTQVFLLDQEGRMARLEASTGRAGAALLARGHALPVGSQSVIGLCTASGEPVVVNDVRGSRIHRPNELLPDTRGELALPLLVGGEVIGALDVQSTEANAFRPDDVRSLQVMASQLASAIDKTRLVDQLQARALENQRLLEEAQRNLRQIEDLSRQVTREGWRDFLRDRRAGTLGYTLQGENVLPDGSWTAPMRQAYQGESSVVIRKERDAHIAALPLRVRGEVIGVLEVERAGDRPWTDLEIEMAETLVERLATAVEGARLYEQATQAAEREQIVNTISQDVQRASSIDEVLRTALAELGDVLGASRGIVQISPRGESKPQAQNGA